MDIFHLDYKCQHTGNPGVGRVFLASTHSHLNIFYKISRKLHRDFSVLGQGFDTFGGSEIHGDGQEQDLGGLKDILSASLGRRIWLPAPLLKNTD